MIIVNHAILGIQLPFLSLSLFVSSMKLPTYLFVYVYYLWMDIKMCRSICECNEKEFPITTYSTQF